MCVGTRGGQKRTPDPLELERQATVSLRVDAGKRTQVLCKSSQCSFLWSLSGPLLGFWSSSIPKVKILMFYLKEYIWLPLEKQRVGDGRSNWSYPHTETWQLDWTLTSVSCERWDSRPTGDIHDICPSGPQRQEFIFDLLCHCWTVTRFWTTERTTTFCYSVPLYRHFKGVWPTSCAGEFLRGLIYACQGQKKNCQGTHRKWPDWVPPQTMQKGQWAQGGFPSLGGWWLLSLHLISKGNARVIRKHP